MDPETVIWKGRSQNGKVLLFSHKLVIERFGKNAALELRDIEKVRVTQRFFGRLCGKGDLWLTFRGKKDPFLVRGLKDPYEGWKQIKIAAFLARKLIDK